MLKIDNYFMYIQENVNAYEMLEEIRQLLDLTIEEFAHEMGWSNYRYYDYLRAGRKRNGKVVITQPGFNKIFDGLNYAIKTYSNWMEYKKEITNIVMKHIIK